MKRTIFSILILLAGYTANAQTIQVSGMPDKPYKQTIDSLFSNLNKSAVTSGVWYDRAYPIANLNRFNQAVADTAANFLFRQSYFQLYHASYSNTALVNPDDFDGIMQYYHNQSKIPLGLINYTYQYLDTNALANNLIYESNGLYYDTPNRPISP